MTTRDELPGAKEGPFTFAGEYGLINKKTICLFERENQPQGLM
jgi:hypothetical protein